MGHSLHPAAFTQATRKCHALLHSPGSGSKAFTQPPCWEGGLPSSSLPVKAAPLLASQQQHCNHQQLQGSRCHPTAFLMFFLFSEGEGDLTVQQRWVPQLPSSSFPSEIEVNEESLSSPAWERAKPMLTESQHQRGWKRPLGSPSPTITLTKLVPTLSHVP